MIGFIKVNKNPKGRRTGDCSTRALCNVLNISYDDALRLQIEESLKCYYDPTSKQVIERVLKKFGWIKMAQPKKSNNSKYEVRELDQLLTDKQMKDGVLVTVANHHTCVRDGYVEDTWYCGYKSVGNYYVKEV